MWQPDRLKGKFVQFQFYGYIQIIYAYSEAFKVTCSCLKSYIKNINIYTFVKVFLEIYV